ncbi:MAG: hypothetical protein KC912_13905 [Proteobacteria bacterium]|nr:hypothetical protein [Pseudomonadota bacterium]
MRPILLVAVALFTLACQQDITVVDLDDGVGGPTDDPTDPVVTDDPTEPTDPVTDPMDDPPPGDDCDHTSDLIYVIDRGEEAIYTFDPGTQQFAFVGDLDCGSFEGSPASMAIGRDGNAYVRYSSNSLFAVDLDTMACSATDYGTSFGSFGMGYATQNDETWRDDLYVANAGSLARVNLQSYALENVGSLPSQSELTGNAAGELWAFLPLESPALLVRLDKTNAEVVQSHSLPAFSLVDLDTFAFANWGGEFFLFVRYYGMGNSTDIYKVSRSGQMSRVASDTGMDVVGAGVSTCAPTE